MTPPGSLKGILEEKTTGKNSYLFFILITDEGKIHRNITIKNSFRDCKVHDRVTIMYDPANRNRAEILEDIPLPVDERGNFCPDRSFFGYFTLVAPYIPLLAVILYIYYTF